MSSTAGEVRVDGGEVAQDGAAADGGVTARIRAFLVDSFMLGEDDGFGNADSLIEAGIVDSTGVMEVVAFLEETFAIAIDDDELVADNLDSVERLAHFVRRKLGVANPR